MNRAVITGLGICASIGRGRQAVTEALQQGRSGIIHAADYAAQGLASQVCGRVTGLEQAEQAIDRKLRRFMGAGSVWAYHSALEALTDAGLSVQSVRQQPRCGVLASSGATSTRSFVDALAEHHRGGLRQVRPYHVPRTMTSTVAAGVATALGIEGLSYGLVSACASSLNNVGHAAELIALGKQDLLLAGGGEEESWAESLLFDAMGALSTRHNDQPERASRPYDRDRDGFVIAGGGGMVVVESLAHAEARGARILAEITGYGCRSDGADMVLPTGRGAAAAMRAALDEAARAGVRSVDYLNTHGTATPQGDLAELLAIREVFGPAAPPLSSTKSMTGHSLGAAGVQELIYCLLMMEHGFIAPNINLDHPDPATRGFDLVRHTRAARLDTVMTNSFGFGGINTSLIVRRWPGS